MELKMATVFDVAKYILEQRGEMTAMKLQKLVYYCQAWNMVWSEEYLFNERIEAWANGAVVKELYQAHKGLFKISAGSLAQGDSTNLSSLEKENINQVLEVYGKFSAQQLSDLNHQEDPWKIARGDLPPLARSENEISKESIYEYHLGIWNGLEEKQS
jgi:uncharacterized phage-associated protein